MARPIRSAEERFADNIEVESGHWLWKRFVHKGVAHFCPEGRKIVSARRWSYARYVGEVGRGMCVRVNCGRENCVHPQHMYLEKMGVWLKTSPSGEACTSSQSEDV